MRSAIKREIQQRASGLEAIIEVYGMGSFFRGAVFQDIDLVIVVNCERDALLRSANAIRGAFSDLSTKLTTPIDLTILTESELASCPLRDMSSLAKVYRRMTGGPRLSGSRVRRP